MKHPFSAKSLYRTLVKISITHYFSQSLVGITFTCGNVGEQSYSGLHACRFPSYYIFSFPASVCQAPLYMAFSGMTAPDTVPRNVLLWSSSATSSAPDTQSCNMTSEDVSILKLQPFFSSSKSNFFHWLLYDRDKEDDPGCSCYAPIHEVPTKANKETEFPM